MAILVKHIVAVLWVQKLVYSKQALKEFAGYCGSKSNLWSISRQWVCAREFVPKTNPEYQFSCHDMGGNCHNMLHGSYLRRDGMCTSSLWNKARASVSKQSVSYRCTLSVKTQNEHKNHILPKTSHSRTSFGTFDDDIQHFVLMCLKPSQS